MALGLQGPDLEYVGVRAAGSDVTEHVHEPERQVLEHVPSPATDFFK